MRLVHLADLHLGHRQYQRQTPAGINQREADVAHTFAKVIDRVVEVAPDLVLIAGDVFQQVRPTNPAILSAFGQISRLMRALPGADVVMVAGNHDTPRSRDTVSILRLFAQLGVHVVEGPPQRLRLKDGAVAVLGVPDAMHADYSITPDPDAERNVLVMHAEIEGTLPQIAGAERAPLIVPVSTIAEPGWDYVALGHYHVHRQVARRAWYSGAIEYTSTNPWGELREETAARVGGKGFIEFDLDTGKHRFHVVPVARPYHDLRAIDGRGLGAVELNARIAEAVSAVRGGIDGCVVRLVLRDVPRNVARDLDHRVLREYRRRALHFQLDVRPPEVTRTSASGAPGRSGTLVETLRARLRDRPLDADLDRERFVQLGVGYLESATSGITAVTETVEDDA